MLSKWATGLICFDKIGVERSRSGSSWVVSWPIQDHAELDSDPGLFDSKTQRLFFITFWYHCRTSSQPMRVTTRREPGPPASPVHATLRGSSDFGNSNCSGVPDSCCKVMSTGLWMSNPNIPTERAWSFLPYFMAKLHLFKCWAVNAKRAFWWVTFVKSISQVLIEWMFW